MQIIKDKLITDSPITDIPSFPPQTPPKRTEGRREVQTNKAAISPQTREAYTKTVRENINYPALVRDMPGDILLIDSLVGLMVETLCTTRPSITISGNKQDAGHVRRRMLQIRPEHIAGLCRKLGGHITATVRSVRLEANYLLTCLYNEPVTFGAFGAAQLEVNHPGGDYEYMDKIYKYGDGFFSMQTG